jgi:integrase
MHFSTWSIDASQILSRQELATVLGDLKRRATRLPNVQMNLAILRLACCCGLRASEIGGLTLGDVRVGIARPRQAQPAAACAALVGRGNHGGPHRVARLPP